MACCEFRTCPCASPDRGPRIQNAPGQTPTETAPHVAALPLEPAPFLTEGGPASSDPQDTMSDQNITATPYPFYATGSDDDSFRATLTSHVGASVERNQDSQFSAARSQLVHRDVQDSKRETVQAKFEAVVAQKDAEIRSIERFAELKAELAAMRAEGLQRDIATLRAEAQGAVLARIAAKLGL